MQNSRMVSPWVTSSTFCGWSGGLEAAVEALQERADPVVHVGTRLALGEAVEEVPVGVAVGLLQPYVVPVLPVAPVLLAQPRLLAHPHPCRVEAERPEGLVGAAVRRDVGADALLAEQLAQPFPGLLPPGRRPLSVSFRAWSGSRSYTVSSALPSDSPCRTRTMRRGRAMPPTLSAISWISRAAGRADPDGASSAITRSRTVRARRCRPSAPPRRPRSARAASAAPPASTRYLPCSADDCHMESTRNSLPGASPNSPRTMPGEPAMAGFHTFSCIRAKCSTRSSCTLLCATRTTSASVKRGSKPVFTSKRWSKSLAWLSLYVPDCAAASRSCERAMKES